MVTSVNVSGKTNETQVDNRVDEIAVRHDIVQSLTETAKTRVRTNIGLGTASGQNTVDAVTDGDLNPVTSNAVFDGLALKQNADTTLSMLAGVTTAANKLIYATGIDIFATTDLTSFARSILDDADGAAVRATIGAGTGTVTSVGGTGTVSGLTLTGGVTASGNLTLGGTLSVAASNFASQTANTFLAAPNGASGVPTFRAIVAADVPTLNQNTTGSSATLTTTRSITMSGDVTWTVNFNGSANVTAAGTIANSAVTLAKMANMATASLIGRNTAGTGAPEILSSTTARTLLGIEQAARRTAVMRPASDDALSYVGLVTRVKKAANLSLAASTLTSYLVDTVVKDEANFTMSGGTLIIPAHLDGAEIELRAGITFTELTGGIRRVQITKAGVGIAESPAVFSTGDALSPTGVVACSSTIRAVVGDSYYVVLYQTGASSIDVPKSGTECWFEARVIRDSPTAANANNYILQGFYQNQAASGTEFGEKVGGRAAISILSHGFDVNDTLLGSSTGSPGCVDTKYTGFEEAIRRARVVNPAGKYFGYVAMSADAPANTTCGYTNSPASPWTSTTIPRVKAWIDAWDNLPLDIRPDGIFFDLVADFSNGGWVNSTTRDACYVYAKTKGFNIASNTVNPSYINVAFAAQNLTKGDLLVVEGFDCTAGTSSTAATITSMVEAAKYRARGVRVCALATSAWGVAPTTTQINAAKATFMQTATLGDTLSVNAADLGIVVTAIYDPAFAYN